MRSMSKCKNSWLNCKRVVTTLIQTSYHVAHDQNHYLLDEKQQGYKVKDSQTSYNVESSSKKYGVCYCVKYRPIWLAEWILARWWWNDKWIWTEDWIFNDWII